MVKSLKLINLRDLKDLLYKKFLLYLMPHWQNFSLQLIYFDKKIFTLKFVTFIKYLFFKLQFDLLIFLLSHLLIVLFHVINRL